LQIGRQIASTLYSRDGTASTLLKPDPGAHNSLDGPWQTWDIHYIVLSKPPKFKVDSEMPLHSEMGRYFALDTPELVQTNRKRTVSFQQGHEPQ
jgi:hypothetical protein